VGRASVGDRGPSGRVEMAQAMTIRESIRSFVAETFFADGFSDEEPFLRSGIIDSMGMLQLVTFLQERFGIAIVDEELVPENLDSVARAAAFVERKLNRSAA
jgi:acyl carrier protein